MPAFKTVPPKDTPFVCSWSGGKDSCLALYRSHLAGARPACLLTMLNENRTRSRSHGLTQPVLLAQADSMSIPLIVGATTWDDYEDVFINKLQEVKANNVNCGVFGDIDLIPHLEWEEKVCDANGMSAYLPLWQTPRADLLEECFAAGFRAMIVTVDTKKMGSEFLGKYLTPDLIQEFERRGIDPCGENGEYHTVVTDGPLFSNPLKLHTGQVIEQPGYCSLDVHV